MIYTHVVSEYSLKPVFNLCGKGNFGQQVKDLTPLANLFFYEMYVNLGLSAGCHSVEQAYVFCFKTAVYLVQCLLLSRTQGRGLTQCAPEFRKPAGFHVIGFQYAVVLKRMKRR